MVYEVCTRCLILKHSRCYAQPEVCRKCMNLEMYGSSKKPYQHKLRSNQIAVICRRVRNALKSIDYIPETLTIEI